jgi:hypothetical protein
MSASLPTPDILLSRSKRRSGPFASFAATQKMVTFYRLSGAGTYFPQEGLLTSITFWFFGRVVVGFVACR